MAVVGTVGPLAMAAMVWPDADSPEMNTWYGRSRSVRRPVSGSSTASLVSPVPWVTARRPSPSTAYGLRPSCHSGPANSSSRGHSSRGNASRSAT